MPIFHYEGVGAQGRSKKGQVDASDERQAYEAVQALGLTVTRLSLMGEMGSQLPWYRRDLTATGDRMGYSEQAEIAGQFAVLFRARLSVSEIVHIIGDSNPRPALREQFGQMEQLIADGATLAQAFERIGTQASPLFLSVLRLADAAPAPADALQALAQFFRRQDGLRRQLVGSLIYPAILVVGAVGVLLLISLFLAPSLAPMFEALNQPVPRSISAFLALGGFLSTNGPLLISLAATATAGLILSWALPGFRAMRRRLYIRLPVLGPAMKAAELGQLVRCTDLLLRAGLSLPEALREAAGSFGGPSYQALFNAAAEALEHGEPAGSVLAAGGQVPPIFGQLIEVGERSNTLPEVLPLLASYMDDRVERSIDRAMKLLTPVITLIVGGGIAMLVYSVMDAILSVNDIAG